MAGEPMAQLAQLDFPTITARLEMVSEEASRCGVSDLVANRIETAREMFGLIGNLVAMRQEMQRSMFFNYIPS